jgi:hypothetical protein
LLSLSLSLVCTLFFLSISPPNLITPMHTCTQPFPLLPHLCYSGQQSLSMYPSHTRTQIFHT